MSEIPVQLRVTPLNTVPWSNGDDTCLTNRKRWFDSIRDYFDGAQIRQLAERLGSGTYAPRGSPSVCRFDACSGYYQHGSVGNWQTTLA